MVGRKAIRVPGIHDVARSSVSVLGYRGPGLPNCDRIRAGQFLARLRISSVTSSTRILKFRTFNVQESLLKDGITSRQDSCNLPNFNSHIPRQTFQQQHDTEPRTFKMGEGQFDEKQSLHVETGVVEAASVVDRNIHVPQGWWNWRVVVNGEFSLSCENCSPNFNPTLSGDYRHILGTFWL